MARELAPGLPYELRIVAEPDACARAHAGRARRRGMDVAAQWLADEAGGQVLLTTDADSRVAPDWIAANLKAVDEGAGGVAGTIALDPDEDAALPDALHRRGCLEAAYGELLGELDARLDPRPHDPWPHHNVASGASLAVTLHAYRLVGGLPELPVGEDRALMAALDAHDVPVRHAPDVRVITSGRLVGRAEGGAADTMRQRSVDPDLACDAALEPVLHAIRRAVWRRRLRLLHGQHAPGRNWGWPLGMSTADAERIGTLRYFGAAWQAIEACSPTLARQGLRPHDLPQQIVQAKLVLRALRATEKAGIAAGDRAGTARLAAAEAWS